MKLATLVGSEGDAHNPIDLSTSLIGELSTNGHGKIRQRSPSDLERIAEKVTLCPGLIGVGDLEFIGSRVLKGG